MGVFIERLGLEVVLACDGKQTALVQILPDPPLYTFILMGFTLFAGYLRSGSLHDCLRADSQIDRLVEMLSFPTYLPEEKYIALMEVLCASALLLTAHVALLVTAT